VPGQSNDGDHAGTDTGVLRIGVTGHRSFDRVEVVTAAVDDVLSELHDESERGMEVWSSLAEGADRLVAERAVDVADAELVVVLPLDVDDYRTDFDSAESSAEFDRLCALAADVTVTGPDASGSRESAYERAGLAIVDAVDVLVAVWDGEPARGRGGTAQIVAAARTAGARVVVIPVTRDAVTL
jgi:hypothetical protein